MEDICHYLSAVEGGSWTIEPGLTLDERFPNQKSPEVRVTDGTRTAAIEVKRVTSDQEYTQSWASLRRFLAPSFGGRYTLDLPEDFALPISKSLMRELRRGIEQHASSLKPGNVAPIPIRRTGRVELGSRKGHSIACGHHCSSDVVTRYSAVVPGAFVLRDDIDDERNWEHRFVTEQGQSEFGRRLLVACAECLRHGGIADVEWVEEWPLQHKVSGTEGVEVIVGTGPSDVPVSVELMVERMVGQAAAKFANRRWADLHIVALDDESLVGIVDGTERLVVGVVNDMDPVDLANVDLILFDKNGTVQELYRNPACHIGP